MQRMSRGEIASMFTVNPGHILEAFRYDCGHVATDMYVFHVVADKVNEVVADLTDTTDSGVAMADEIQVIGNVVVAIAKVL